MTTDEERREAARRLRGYVGMPDGWWQETLPQFYIEKCVFGDLTRHGEDELFARLADLIDPGELKTTCIAEVKIEGEKLDEVVNRAIAEYTGIDRDALLALAEEMSIDGMDGLLIPMSEYARRIREACGEVGR